MKTAQKRLKVQTVMIITTLAILFTGFVILAAAYGNYLSSQKSDSPTDNPEAQNSYSLPRFTPIVRAGGM